MDQNDYHLIQKWPSEFNEGNEAAKQKANVWDNAYRMGSEPHIAWDLGFHSDDSDDMDNFYGSEVP